MISRLGVWQAEVGLNQGDSRGGGGAWPAWGWREAESERASRGDGGRGGEVLGPVLRA